LNKIVKSCVIFALFKSGVVNILAMKKSKQQLILEAAQKRFAMYGIEKTTMQEIADDLNIVKGSLYYYFPDKENLYKAVIEAEQTEFLRMVKEDLENIHDSSEALNKYLINRLSYFKKLVNLSRMRAESLSEYRPLISESVIEFREKEKKIVQGILEGGREKGEFAIEDTYETAGLFLDLLRGLRRALLEEKKLLFVEEEEYNILLSKTLSFARIFINGLKVNAQK
jgi:AcrR family transcriptional regulator